MSDLVFEDRGDQGPSHHGSAPWIWSGLIIGVVAGVTAVVLLGAGDDVGQTSTVPTQPAVPVVATAPGATGRAAVASAPTLPVAISAVVHSGTQGLDMLILSPGSSEGDVDRERLPFGLVGSRPVPTIDSSGRFVAVEEPLADQEGSVLYAGYVRSVGIVATNVTGHAWDDEVPGRLVYSVERDGVVEIKAIDQQFTFLMPLAARRSWSGMTVTAAGPWGIALQGEAPDRVLLLTPRGRPRGALDGRLMDSSPDGQLLISRGETLYVLDDNGQEHQVLIGRDVRESNAIRDGLGPVVDASLLSDWYSLAVVGEGGVVMIGSRGARLFQGEIAGPGIVHDGHFAAVRRAAGGLWVIDLRTGGVSIVFDGEDVTAIGMGS
jgi:hypothetical protein